MGVTTEKSTEVTNVDADPIVKVAYDKAYGPVKLKEFNFTQGAAAGDINSTADLCYLPPGARVFPSLSKLQHSAFGSSQTLDIGYTAHTDKYGVAVTAAVDVIADGVAVNAAGDVFLGTGTNAINPSIKLTEEIQEGKVKVQAKCLVGTLPIGATLTGWIAYT